MLLTLGDQGLSGQSLGRLGDNPHGTRILKEIVDEASLKVLR